MYEFKIKTGRVIIDQVKCRKCNSYVCAKACSLSGRAIVKIRDKKPVVLDLAEAERRCNECLACEQECELRGKGALRIELPTPEIDAYQKAKRAS